MNDWNGSRYHELSAPQQRWGLKVLDQLTLAGNERVLDAGCGTGHLTAAIAARVPDGRVVGADVSPSMLGTAAAWLQEHAPYVRLVRADAAALPFNRVFDVIFSTATFHWVADHGALFRSLIAALRPGGRLKAQCGGGPNLAVLYARAEGLMASRRFAPYFTDWRETWHFADVDSTVRRLSAAGFTDADVSLEPSPVTFDTPSAYMEFVRTVCVRPHLDRLPADERGPFVRELTLKAAADAPALTLDYWRLNLFARRPA